MYVCILLYIYFVYYFYISTFSFSITSCKQMNYNKIHISIYLLTQPFPYYREMNILKTRENIDLRKPSSIIESFAEKSKN